MSGSGWECAVVDAKDVMHAVRACGAWSRRPDTRGPSPRLSVRVLCLALVVCGISAVSGPAAAQPIMVDLGAEVVVLTPDATVGLPVTLSLPGDGPVQITLEIAYPADVLKFLSAAAGFSVEVSDAELRAEPKPAGAGDAEQVLSIEIKSAKPLTSGTLATLTFALTSAAKPGTEVPIRNLRRTAMSAAGKEMETRGTEGLLTLVEPPAPCFFYMH